MYCTSKDRKNRQEGGTGFVLKGVGKYICEYTGIVNKLWEGSGAALTLAEEKVAGYSTKLEG